MAKSYLNLTSGLLFVIFISIFASFASAAPSLSVPSELNFGDADRNATKSASFTINNNGDAALNNILFSANAPSGYNVTFDQSNFSLNAGSNKNIQATVKVPFNADTGANISLGTISITSDQFNTSFPIKLSVKGGLQINELRMSIDYSPSYAFRKSSDRKDSASGISNGAKLDLDIEPDSTISLDINVENLFEGDDDELDIRGVQATVALEEIDDGEDIEEVSPTIDLTPGDDQWLSVKLEVPKRVEHKTYNMNIIVDGNGDNGETHTIEWNIDVPVIKESHDVRFEGVNLQQNLINCGQSTNIVAGIYNAGRNAESDLKLEVKNEGLYLNYVKSGISLDLEKFDEDSVFEATVPISVGNAIKPGKYPIQVNVYWQGSILFDQRIVDLEVKCGGEAPAQPKAEEKPKTENKTTSEEEKKNEVPVAAAPKTDVKTAEPQTETEEPVTVSKESSFRDSPLYLPVIIGINLAVLLGIFAAVLYFVRKR